MDRWKFTARPHNDRNLRVIKTARTIDVMNYDAKEGFHPLVKVISQNEDLNKEYWVVQHTETGEIRHTDDRHTYWLDFKNDWKTVVCEKLYYPYPSPEPFAAYLVPNDIAAGERVFLEDVIQDIVWTTFGINDGYENLRIGSCKAIWTGTDFLILSEETDESIEWRNEVGEDIDNNRQDSNPAPKGEKPYHRK